MKQKRCFGMLTLMGHPVRRTEPLAPDLFQLRGHFRYWGDFGDFLGEGMCNYTEDGQVLLSRRRKEDAA
jgi:hypothetical protein